MSSSRIPAYLISGSGTITLHMDGKVYTAGPNHVNYKAIKNALKAKAWKKLPDLFDVGKAITKRSRKVLRVKDGQIFYGSEPLHNTVVDRIFSFMSEGLDFKPLLSFLKRWLDNPSENGKQELYDFLEKNSLPITWDGYIICYKRVDDDYKDFHSHTFDSHVGNTVKMERSKCQEDRDNPCRRGLHVGGMVYVNGFNGGHGHVMVVKVDPKNVVSVPTDCNYGKMRCCEYFVLEEIADETKSIKSVMTQAEASKVSREEDEDETCSDCGLHLNDCYCEEYEDDE